MSALRAVLRLAAAFALLFALPAGFVRAGTPENADVAFSVGALVRDLGPALGAVLVPAVAAAWLASGAGGLAAAARWLGGDRDATRAALAARALASAARGALAAGLVLSIAALVLVGATIRATADGGEPPAPAFFARGLVGGLLPAMWALLAGRAWLGAHAASAATAAGERHGRTLRGWSELAVPLLLVLLPALLMLSTLYRYPTLPR